MYENDWYKSGSYSRPPPTRALGIRFKGFTLAEVLITLGIIGIVAALTIPVLISSYKKKVYSSRLKEFYSVMTQAVQLSEIENGPRNTWKKHSLSENYDEDGNLDTAAASSHCYDFFITYIAPYIKYVNEDIKTNRKFYFINGMSVTMWNGNCIDMNVDVNGDAGPNTAGIDFYNFQMCLDSKIILNPGPTFDGSRDELVQKCKDSPSYCTSLLKFDNWEFKEDYPYKL